MVATEAYAFCTSCHACMVSGYGAVHRAHKNITLHKYKMQALIWGLLQRFAKFLPESMHFLVYNIIWQVDIRNQIMCVLVCKFPFTCKILIYCSHRSVSLRLPSRQSLEGTTMIANWLWQALEMPWLAWNGSGRRSGKKLLCIVLYLYCLYKYCNYVFIDSPYQMVQQLKRTTGCWHVLLPLCSDATMLEIGRRESFLAGIDARMQHYCQLCDQKMKHALKTFDEMVYT